MDHYHIWCDLRDGVNDLEFASAVHDWLGALRERGTIEDWQLERRKLGFGPDGLGQWHVDVHIRDMAQLEQAFGLAAARTEPLEGLHAAVHARVCNLKFALYRDFPPA